MPINNFEEKTIRDKILSKIEPTIKKGRSKHQKGYIYIDGKVEAKVKIPNNHNRIMKESKSQYIATSLHLSHDEFNDLIDCPISGPQYFDLLRKSLEKKSS